MVDIVEEIINDEKDAKRVYYFRKFLPAIIVLTVVIAIAMAGYSYYSAQREEHTQKIGDMFIDIVSGDVADPTVAYSSLQDIIENSDVKISELAKIRLIHDKIISNQVEDAKELLKEIINDSDVLEITKSYAHIVYFSIVLDQETISDADQLQMSNLFQYFNNDSKMFYANSKLMKALFHYRLGQLDIAHKIAGEIINMQNAAFVIKDQANALQVVIKYKK